MASGAVIHSAPEQPQNDNDDQDDAENSPQSCAAITIVTVVTTPTAEQQDDQDDQKIVPILHLYIGPEAISIGSVDTGSGRPGGDTRLCPGTWCSILISKFSAHNG